jgi:hypothetical protein
LAVHITGLIQEALSEYVERGEFDGDPEIAALHIATVTRGSAVLEHAAVEERFCFYAASKPYTGGRRFEVGTLAEKQEIIWPEGGRRLVGIISLIGAAASLGGLILAAKFELGYISYLILEFLFFQFIFHAGYAYAQKLTQRQVRKIDYWYLGAAAIGMILFALNYTEQREAYLGKANVIAFKAQEAKLVQEAKAELAIYNMVSCGDVVARASKGQCKIADGYTDKLKPGMTATELSEMEASFRQQLVKTYSAIRQEYKKTYPNESNADDAYFMQAARFQVRLEELRQTVAATPTSTKPKIVDEEMQVLLGLGQTLVWPLLLAFALALRLAKVTVDVFGWAE